MTLPRKRIHAWVPLLFFSLCGPCLCQAGRDSVKITYVANDGFLLSAPGKKVLVDALFNTGWGTYLTPAAAEQEKMRNAQAPFDGIDLFLITHNHGDHFNADMVINAMSNSPNGVLMAPLQVIEALKAKPGYAGIKPRVSEIPPAAGASPRDTTIHGIGVRAMGIRHSPYFVGGVDQYEGLQHVAYLVRLNGSVLLHCGDASMDYNEAVVRGFQFDQSGIGLLFLSYFDESGKSIQLIDQLIKPQRVVGMHIPPSDWDGVSRKFLGSFPNAVVFKASMESKSFGNTTSVSGSGSSAPGQCRLYPCYPNPFNPSTAVRFRTARRSYVSLKVFDVTGREIEDLAGFEMDAGEHSLEWNPGRRLGGGVYVMVLSAGQTVETRKIVYQK
jgi:L-ascorbate metabolism protein UlaG (beta-lactamase superfamily)